MGPPPHPAREDMCTKRRSTCPAVPGVGQSSCSPPATATTGHRRAALLASGVAAGTLAATAQASPTARTAASVAALSANWYESAPYYSRLDSSAPDLGPVMSATGQKAFELAFILSGGGCSPPGTAPTRCPRTPRSPLISQIRGAGGDVSISIGGYGGTKLGEVCGTPAATAAAYQQVITKYALKAVDFDLEEPEYENTTSINNEVGAAKILQTNNPGLYVSITTAATTTGTGYFGQNVMNTAKGLGFTPNNYSIMPFDGGFRRRSSDRGCRTSTRS